MSRQHDELFSEALKLPPAARAKLAVELIASFDGEPDPGAEEAWAAEIDERVRRIDAEGSTGEDADVVLARLAARLRRK